MSFLWIAIAVFVALQVLDAALTVSVLNMGGRETNPLLAKIFKNFDPKSALILAKLFVVIVIAGVALAGGFNNPMGNGIVCVLDLIYLFVIKNNVKAYREQKQIYSMRPKS